MYPPSLLDSLGQAASSRRHRRVALSILLTLICVLFLFQVPTSISTRVINPQTWSPSKAYATLFNTPENAEPGPSDTIPGRYMQSRIGPHWHGWSSIRHMIVFGDSWTMTDYHHAGERASPGNALGNPGWPGITSTAGPNWVGYLTYKFNASLILTANFAVGGATIDTALVRQGVPHFIPSDLGAQVADHFGGGYIDNSTYDWHVDSSIFVVWMGINDIHEQDETTEAFFPRIFELFADRMDTLYSLGARNIVFMNVPPLERSPLATGAEHERLSRLVTGWNHNLTSLVQNLTESYNDLSTFFFNTYDLYQDVLEDPCILPQTCELKVLEGFCPKYAFAWVWEDPACPYHVDKYFWLNDFHPTSPVHNVTAAALAIELAAVHPLEVP